MLTFPANVRLFLARKPVDCRKSFDGLAGIVENEFGHQPTSGDLFIFLNKRATQVRMLFWDRDGFCLVAKRLESGTFRRVDNGPDTSAQLEIDRTDLCMLLEGVDAVRGAKRKRFALPQEKTSDVKKPLPQGTQTR